MNFNKSKIAVIGLGYVGLPLAIEFGKKRRVIGFDLNKKRINELKKNRDSNFEISKKEFKLSKNLVFTNKIQEIKNCKIFIATIPTPINYKNQPDLNLLKKCCEMIGSIIKKDDLVIFESTVYPGVTEEICSPIIEKKSGLKFNKDFFCGYSPERVNPGDKNHHISNIKKVTSGSTPETSKIVDQLYKKIIKAGTYNVSSIKVAEAAKVIENTQRDLNIALINELYIIFDKLNIDTKSVLDAASTKWNFLSFKPGFVGGHCIGVDPYYLAYKSLKVGHNPNIILSGRKINNEMPFYVAKKLKKNMKEKKIDYVNAKVLIMGFAFKENCPDFRNTKVADLVNGIKKYNKSKIDIYDPWINKIDVKKIYGFDLIRKPFKKKYDLVVFAVAHDEFKKFTKNQIKDLVKKDHIIYDFKYLFKS
jgi:UDP-N-acetyl-D-glucosamine/UDP-N-acetyl-D-galactosamine dehydrogenase